MHRPVSKMSTCLGDRASCAASRTGQEPSSVSGRERGRSRSARGNGDATPRRSFPGTFSDRPVTILDRGHLSLDLVGTVGYRTTPNPDPADARWRLHPTPKSPTVECDVGNHTIGTLTLTAFLTGRSVKATEVSGGRSVADRLQLEDQVGLAPRFDGRCFVDGFHGARSTFRALREIEANSKSLAVSMLRRAVRRLGRYRS